VASQLEVSTTQAPAMPVARLQGQAGVEAALQVGLVLTQMQDQGFSTGGLPTDPTQKA
jgi:hypothetical protein